MRLKKFLKCAVHVIYVLILLYTLLHIKSFSVNKLLSYTPPNKLLAAGFILAFYVFKSLTVFFPVAILQLSAGFLFPAHIALLVNCVGSLLEFSVAYFVGRISGGASLEGKISANRHIHALFLKQAEHPFFIPFFLRIISCLPCDLVSMYFGAMRLPFFTFLAASFIGTLPGIIPVTFMGRTVTSPTSPQFILSALFTVLCAALSAVIFWFHCRRENKKQ